jgi:RimJ/RimL family protein N-acetyltransferase
MSSDRPLPPARIEYGDRFVLRPVEPSDIPRIEEAKVASLADLHPYMDWSHRISSPAYFLNRVLTQWGSYFRGEDYEMALFDKQTSNFLVYTGFYPSLRLNPYAFEIGYWSSSLHKGKGLATLATRMQIALIFEYFHGERIEVTCSPHNQASLRVIEKCGFSYEGTLRNFYPQGTESMYAAGYVRDRSVQLFALLPEDRPHLPWYQSLTLQITLYPLLDPPFPLRNASL